LQGSIIFFHMFAQHIMSWENQILYRMWERITKL